MTKRIPLTRGQEALVDDDDYERLMLYSWYAKSPYNCNGWYAARQEMDADIGKQYTVYMHDMVLNFPDDIVDHIDRNTLNNQKQNLRCVTRSQSAANRILPVGVSSYRGVTRSGRKWIARIAVDGERIYIGTFDTAEEAAREYDLFAVHHYGPTAITNIKEST
jgi:HNH endonuclease